MAQYVENTEEEEAWRTASMQVIRHARELQALAAARTRANALAVLESGLRRQTLRLRPWARNVGSPTASAALSGSNSRYSWSRR